MKKNSRVLAEDGVEVKPTSSDEVLNWMYKNLPPEKWTLAVYIELNWWDGRTTDDLDGEELAALPEELYPEPANAWRT